MTPDVKFSLGDKHFAVECKWRNHFYQGKINWAKDYQVVNYGRYQNDNDEPVFIAIGIGGTPSKPNTFYLIPFKRLTKTYATEDYLKYNIVRSKKGALNLLSNVFSPEFVKNLVDIG
jgi:hypothetical protein